MRSRTIMKMTLRYLSLVVLCILPFSVSTKDMTKDEKKIHFLINSIEKSNAIFIRNNTNHTSKEAAEHLRYKLERAKKSFWFFSSNVDVTVENFINKIASKSSFSGKDYHMKLKDGSIVTTKSWLIKALKDLKI